MSANNQPQNLPIEINLLDEKKNIVTLNSEHKTILEEINQKLKEPQYNSIVTMANSKAMKESATELNKTSKFISDFRIAKKKDEMKHIAEFEENLKSYCELINNKRDNIKDGLNVFEEETRKEVNAVCTSYALQLFDTMQLRDEFRGVNLADMTQTGYMTSKGFISKKGKDEIEKRVNEKLALQNRVDNRLLNLENECLKNGIAPMGKEYVQGFLYESDAVYQEKLNSLIQIEIKRAESEKNRIEDEAKIKAEKEAEEKVLAEQKALKDEIHGRYENLIKTADMPNLTRINLELKSYEDSATYELRQLSKQRETELLNPVEDEEVSQEEQHLKAIQNETIKKDISINKVQDDLKAIDTYEVKVNEKVEKTLSIKIRVPATATDEQVIGAVINMIKADRLPLENFEVN